MPTLLKISKFTVTGPHCLAIASTLIRLLERYRTRRMWWDDYMALISLAFDFPYFVTYWIRAEVKDPQSIPMRVTLYWIALLFFPCVLWTSRISIAFSIVRILPPRTRLRRVTKAIAMSFGLICIALLAQRGWACGHESDWHHKPGALCRLPASIGIAALGSDVYGDVALIVVSLLMLRRLKLAKPQRHLILSIFAASILTSVASIAFGAFLIGAGYWGPGIGQYVGMTAHVEAATSLFVCNLLVIVTYIYRVFRRRPDLETLVTEGWTATTRERSIPMTTFVFTEISEIHTVTSVDTNPPLEELQPQDSKTTPHIRSSLLHDSPAIHYGNQA